ncbi:hypothetical protein EPUL_004051 [Erysiphe pulchra]|uniref:Histone acetyltransferase n=1 Tax=Erysiphe pulchra TaxID=225359 RepID=A0A2S4PYU6_9PEZI|nr:hypothetical protein EPUL_004051 [Erysiphe pulchra]
MAGQRRGIDTSEDDADYEEDDEILVRKHLAGRLITKNQPYHDIAENHIEVISEHTDNVVKSDDKPDGHYTPSHQRTKRKCEVTEQHEEDEYEKKRNARKLHSVGNDDGSDVSMADDDSSNSTDTDVEEPWIPAPEDEDDLVTPNCCIYCHKDEENDPSEEFELYLACGICGDNAHRQCARNANALQTEDGKYECLSNNLAPKKTTQQATSPSKRRIALRDKSIDSLQQTQGRLKKENSHVASNQPTLLEGSKGSPRLLRKRRNSCTSAGTQETNNPRTRSGDKNLNLRYRNSSFFDEDYWKSDEMEIDTPESPLKSPMVNGRKTTYNKTFKTRSLIPRSSPLTQEFARIIERTSNTLKIAIKLDTAEVSSRLSQPPKFKKKRRTSVGTISTMASSNFVPSTLPQSFYSLHDRELDESKSKPYGGILTEEQADTTLTMPKPEDRQKFDEARRKAEEDWKARVAATSEAASIAGNKKSRKFSELTSEIEYIEFGKFQIDVWYDAPYPEEYSRNKALFICEYCLKYMESDIVAWRHTKKCPWKTPPGDEIYRDGNVAVFEVDGRKNTLYCQNLCLLAKLFLGSKTLYYDVEPFLFYVMTEYDQYGCHFVGYFSKEKRPSSLNNVSCILVLPIHQQKGYGHLLIDFSYLLTRVEKKTGSPEKPLSDMGLVSYRNYWRLVLCRYLKDFKPGDKIPSIREISDSMGLTPDDVISALDALGTLIRDPITGTYAMKITPDYYQEVFQRYESRKYVKLNPKALFWTPFLLGRGIEPSFDYISFNKIVPEDEHEGKGSLAASPTESKKRHYDSFMCCHEESNTVTTKSLGKLHIGEKNPALGSLGDDLETIRANLNNINNNHLNLNFNTTNTTTTTTTTTTTMTTSTSKLNLIMKLQL